MENKKEYILKQVAQLYMRHGIRSITMDDVAAELGMSKKTVYLYFKDKADLVGEVVTNFLMKDEAFHCEENKGLNAIDRVFWIREHINNMLDLVHNNMEYDLRKGYPKEYKKITEYKRKRIYQDNLSIMEQGKAEGLFREEVDNDFVARISVGRFLLVFNPDHEIFSEEEVRDIRLFDQVIDYHFHGICTEKGLKYYKQQLNNAQNEN
ncbi:TetR/AcrR family transcriptional regulator [uncultured Sunxiuqinia sp.]|uniref:TetR/AcrR family transcriptional regulator n=1 Tax=Sunxiuqinia rutila TaxID=1397841 RepID=UPI00262F48AA|nr:TetR/AcrR family transcriptional regulator [uncultured Sunxiuqinia sp.]